jgi:histidine ammonia-lyase
VDTIPTSAGQEDHVSMGNAAGLKAWQVLANAERVVAIELLAGAQAVEFHAPLEPGVGPRAARELVRSVSPRLGDDRSLSDDIEAIAAAIRDGSAVAAVEAKRASCDDASQTPIPKRPFRDSALFYAGIAIVRRYRRATGSR